jgi:hypothetical protein
LARDIEPADGSHEVDIPKACLAEAAQEHSEAHFADLGLGTLETAVAARIADMVNHTGEPDDAGSIDGRLWDLASVA